MNFKIKYKQVGTQSERHGYSQFPDLAASYPTKTKFGIQGIRCVSPITFSQRVDELQALKIAEEFEQAIEDNSLEKIEQLLKKVLEIGGGMHY